MIIEAMKQALEALETCNWVDDGGYGHAEYDHVSTNKAITALRQAIEQAQKQEPVAWMTHSNDITPLFHKTRKGALNWQLQPTPLYTSPPPRQPLTDEQILHRVDTHVGGVNPGNLDNSDWIQFARAIEAAHGIKENT